MKNQGYMDELKAYLDLQEEDGNPAIEHILLFLRKEITVEYNLFLEQLRDYSERIIIMLEKPELSYACHKDNDLMENILTEKLIKSSRFDVMFDSILYSADDLENETHYRLII